MKNETELRARIIELEAMLRDNPELKDKPILTVQIQTIRWILEEL